MSYYDLKKNIVCGCASFCAAAISLNQGFSSESKWTHFGVRPLAMGNAYVAVADDFNAIFYNPAGLARLPDWHGELINPYVSISKSTSDLVKNLTSLQSSQTDQVLSAIDEMTGKSYYVGAGLTPHLVFPNFGLGIGLDTYASLAIHGDISIDVDTRATALIPVAFAQNFWGERLSLGTAVKYVATGGIDKNISIADIDSFKSNSDSSNGKSAKLTDYVDAGSGVGVDTGLLFTPKEIASEPTFGLSITDVGGTTMKATGSYLTPKTRPPSVNSGISFKPYKSPSSYILTSVDVHSINNRDHFSKKLNLGLEWSLGSILKLETGLHQGELTGGFQFDAWLLVIRFATYSEQIGSTAGEDDLFSERRYVLQLKVLI